MHRRLKIGRLAALFGVSRDTVRFYEREGLLPRPARTDSQHRIYDRDAARRLGFIRRAQEIGLTLEDIRSLLELRESRSRGQCRGVAARLAARVAAVDAQIATLRRVRRRLGAHLDLCRRTRSQRCPTLARLEADGRTPAER